MYKRLLVAACLATASGAFVSGQAARPQLPALRPGEGPVSNAPASSVPDVSQQRALLDQYCVPCHNEKLKTANLLLDQLDLAHVSDHAEAVEKVVRKLRAGMMPPSGMPRPDPVIRETSHLLGR